MTSLELHVSPALLEQVVGRFLSILAVLPLAFVAGFTQMALYYTVSPTVSKSVSHSCMLVGC